MSPFQNSGYSEDGQTCTSIDRLLAKIGDGSLVPDSEDFDEIAALNQRDSTPFETRWLAAFQSVEAARDSEVDASRVDELRKQVYLSIFKKWKSAELAAAMSDDIGLIGDALLFNVDDPWIVGLFHEYLQKRFPRSDALDRMGTLSDLLKA